MIGRYTVGASAGDLVGWTPETLAAALRPTLGNLGIEVVCEPRCGGVNEGLELFLDNYQDIDELTAIVGQIVEMTIQN